MPGLVQPVAGHHSVAVVLLRKLMKPIRNTLLRHLKLRKPPAQTPAHHAHALPPPQKWLRWTRCTVPSVECLLEFELLGVPYRAIGRDQMLVELESLTKCEQARIACQSAAATSYMLVRSSP